MEKSEAARIDSGAGEARVPPDATGRARANRHDSDLWHGVVANRRSSAQVDDEHAAAILQALQQFQAEEAEQRVIADHGLPNA